MAASYLTNFENVLQTIHGQYISQPKDEVNRNNQILKEIVDQIINEMKDNGLFNRYYNRIFYGGSYFDDLKVGSPDEFDLDILLKIPSSAEPKLEHTNEPGYLSLRFLAPNALTNEFKKTFLDDKNFLSSAKVRYWMKGVFTKALNKFRLTNREYAFTGGCHHLTGRLSESGPAVTLLLKGQGINIDIDFVPSFEFSKDQWPTAGYRTNPVHSKSTFFIVPKSPKNSTNANLTGRYWRLSFQEQERELIKEKKTLKPTLKLIKRLRYVHQHKSVASYYIKTIFLWENEKNGSNYWDGSLTDAFFKMLDKYIEYIEQGTIPYFWNKKNNLLNVSSETKNNMVNCLKAIRKDVGAKYQTEPLVICKYLGIDLKPEECLKNKEKIVAEVQLSNGYRGMKYPVSDTLDGQNGAVSAQSGFSWGAFGVSCLVAIPIVVGAAYLLSESKGTKSKEKKNDL